MVRILNYFKNKFKLEGSYSWALVQMKEGFIIRSESLSYNKSLFYDYEYNKVMINVEALHEINSYVFANEFLYKLEKISNFYVSTDKKFAFTARKHIKHIDASFKEYFNITKTLFK